LSKLDVSQTQEEETKAILGLQAKSPFPHSLPKGKKAPSLGQFFGGGKDTRRLSIRVYIHIYTHLSTLKISNNRKDLKYSHGPQIFQNLKNRPKDRQFFEGFLKRNGTNRCFFDSGIFSKNENWAVLLTLKYLKNQNRRFFKNSKNHTTLGPPPHHPKLAPLKLVLDILPIQ